MEDPIFYQAYPAGPKISLREKQALLKQIVRLEGEVQHVLTHADALVQRCRKMGISVPAFCAYSLQQCPSLIRGLRKTLSKKNRPN